MLVLVEQPGASRVRPCPRWFLVWFSRKYHRKLISFSQAPLTKRLSAREFRMSKAQRQAGSLCADASLSVSFTMHWCAEDFVGKSVCASHSVSKGQISYLQLGCLTRKKCHGPGVSSLAAGVNKTCCGRAACCCNAEREVVVVHSTMASIM